MSPTLRYNLIINIEILKTTHTMTLNMKSDQLEETTGLEKLSGDIRLFCVYFAKSIETNLPIQKNIQENE